MGNMQNQAEQIQHQRIQNQHIQQDKPNMWNETSKSVLYIKRKAQ
jgi:hypothetical protein